MTRILRCLLIVVTLTCACGQARSSDKSRQDGDWLVASASSVGMDAASLDETIRTIRREGYAIDSILVVRQDRLIYERYLGTKVTDLHPVYSCTKSVMSALVGIAIAQGKIGSLDQPVVDLLPTLAWDTMEPAKQKITLRHLLTMTSGLSWPEIGVPYGAGSVFSEWLRRGGTAQFVMDRSLEHEPGTVFNYSSGGSHVISAILEAQTGMGTRAYAEQVLFTPLGIATVSWETDRDGIPFGGHGLNMRSRDMAKIGLLYLHQGEWQGEQIVPAQWVRESTQQQVVASQSEGYGYQWWVYPRVAPDEEGVEVYGAMGYLGQHIYVIPAKEMVVVFTAELRPEQTNPVPKSLLEQYILPAAR